MFPRGQDHSQLGTMGLNTQATYTKELSRKVKFKNIVGDSKISYPWIGFSTYQHFPFSSSCSFPSLHVSQHLHRHPPVLEYHSDCVKDTEFNYPTTAPHTNSSQPMMDGSLHINAPPQLPCLPIPAQRITLCFCFTVSPSFPHRIKFSATH